MPKPTKGPRLGGSSSHQKAMLANLATSLFEHGRIKTTEPKARALRPYAEKLITHAKKGTLHNRREVLKKIRDKDVVHALFAEIGPFFADRDGGYTRIIKVEARKGDNAPMAVIELVREKTVTDEADRARRAGRVEEGRARDGRRAAPQAAVEPEAGRRAAERDRRRGQGRGRRHRGGPGPAEAEAEERRGRRRPSADEDADNVLATCTERARHRFRWRVCSSSARYRLRRNRVRRLGGAGRAAHRGGRARRRVVDGVPHAGAAACGGPHRRRRARHRSGGARRRADRRAAARLSAHAAPGRQRVPAAGAHGSRGSCPPTCGSLDIARAAAGFDARFSALRRHYVYRLSTAPYGVEPQEARYVTRVAAAARRRRDVRRVAGPGGSARLRRVLPTA